MFQKENISAFRFLMILGLMLGLQLGLLDSFTAGGHT
jgi:hypothetical protein